MCWRLEGDEVWVKKGCKDLSGGLRKREARERVQGPSQVVQSGGIEC